jgi:hypothetical protein
MRQAPRSGLKNTSVAADTIHESASSALSRVLDGLKGPCALPSAASSHLHGYRHPHDKVFLRLLLVKYLLPNSPELRLLTRDYINRQPKLTSMSNRLIDT